MDVVSFDPAQASELEFTGYYELAVAASAADRPDVTPASFEAMVQRMNVVGAGLCPIRYWVAKQDERIVAAAIVELPGAENAQHAVVEIRVHPSLRRRGIGTEVLRALLPHLRALGRTRLTGRSVLADGVSERWAAHLGFKRMHGFVIQLLNATEVDQDLWDVPVPAGYRLQQWTGPVSPEILDSYSRARNAIHDAPQGEVTLQLSPQWTPERVREQEADLLRQGIVFWTLVAIHEVSAEVAGLTEILFYPGFDADAYQEDTSVTVEHRGHGLGRCMKAAMLRRLVDERPEVRRVRTRTAADNIHMQRVNHEVGYKTVREIADVEADLRVVDEHLG
jgi:mycothiol synthase